MTWKGDERRCRDNGDRRMFDRLVAVISTKARMETKAVAAEAAETALQRFGELTPWDLETKKGRDEMRQTISHSYSLMKFCRYTKKVMGETVIQFGVRVSIAVLIVGFLVSVGIDLHMQAVFEYLFPSFTG